MASELKLPALEGREFIKNNTVSVISDDGAVIQVGIEEWKLLREKLRFDDSVDYERGETPMTHYQLQTFVELIRENTALEMEIKRLKGDIHQRQSGGPVENFNAIQSGF